ncbi:P-loop containing nucleoside triphosphate hydrolase [Pseudocohnilembus persalinus]|uniref:p-loop containing nucleoside triphosphate hydrolase n=1 Tax=Pseudocohnilembus persalinus TaxID=266149 RepID=A0A0V0QF21_PSEPJ|nr:P-loop containing nucleoside triphosphate hydrolase [Pseudocohnilembus persalinus]|eukprot:KRX00793.1 P-loop containing nucleoside triphosphate hydrolase [Pseudocohnilembus persalinus]
MGHLQALIKKNFKIWKRGGCVSYLEIILPVLFCCFFILMRNVADKKEFEKHSFLQFDEDFSRYIPNNLTSEFPSNLVDKDYQEIQLQRVFIQNCKNNQNGGKFEQNGKVALAPRDNEIIQKIGNQIENFGFDLRFFDDQNQIMEYLKSQEYNDDICLGISMPVSEKGKKYNYYLHFNSTGQSDNQIPGTQFFDKYNNYKIENLEDFVEPWVKSGFVTLQNWMDNLILQQEGSDVKILPTVTSFTVEEHLQDNLPDLVVGNFGTFTTLPLIIVFLRFLQKVVSEKEKKIREHMRIMGLHNSSFYLSWILQYMAIYFVITVITAIFCCLTIFTHSDFVLICVWYYLFCLNSIAQALAISALFSKAKTANIFGLVIYLGFYIITIIIGNNNGIGRGSKIALSIFPQVNQSISADSLILIESKQKGIGWDDLGEEVNRFSIGISLGLFVATFIITMLLFFYLEQVFPNDYGVQKHPLFCLGFKKKFKTKKSEQNKHYQKDENIEDVEQNLKQLEKENKCVKVDNVVKVYSNGKMAVNNLSLTMYLGQIYCLLGPNGSGKSTLISMLTGMFPMSEGRTKIMGYDLSEKMGKIRKIIGVCPQQNILFKNLTVYEHLQLFATIKNERKNKNKKKENGKIDKDESQNQNQNDDNDKDKDKIEQEIEQLLDDVDLQDKRDEYSKNLSGGQKRRLQVALAFVGGSKVIFLDEPTSGCDTSVRRHLWEMLKKYKQDRIIVLTTHFMDEADYLGDRISIIGEGKLICTGSSTFLKNRFGVGYNLTIVKNDPTSSSHSIIQTIKKHIPNVSKISQASAEITFQLNMSEVGKFQDMFNELDEKKSELDISNYGISITTMEQVFIDVCQKNQSTNDEEEEYEQEKEQQNENEKQMQNQENSSFLEENFNLNDVRIRDRKKLFLIHFWALVKKRVQFLKRDKKGLACEVLIPCIMIIFGLYIVTISSSYSDEPYDLIASEIYDFQPKTIYGWGQQVSQQKVEDILENFREENYKFIKYDESQDVEDWDKFVFEKKDKETLGAYWLKSYQNENNQNQNNQSQQENQVEYILEINSLYRESLPLYLSSMNEALLKQILKNRNFQLESTIYSFPLTAQLESLKDSAQFGLGSAFIFSLLLSFIPSSLVFYVIKERREQIKHLQFVSGVGLKTYWLSNYFIDLCKYIFPVYFVSLLFVQVYGISVYCEEGAAFAALAVLLFFYGVAVIAQSYLLSFLFEGPGNGQVFNFFLNYIVGAVVPLVIWIFRVFFESTREAFGIVQWVFRVFPAFCLGDGLLNLASRVAYLNYFEDVDSLQGPFHIDIASGDIIFMIVMTIVFCVGILLVEGFISKGTFEKFQSKQNGFPKYKPVELDDDVQKEADEVQKAGVNGYKIVLNKIRKVFKLNKQKYLEAVKQVSVGIKSGECFALLGINGAGKTTLFKILSGDYKATSGEAYINGHNINTEMDIARYDIGYCPQFDALLENLTTREHLELYTAIKGIPKKMRKPLIDSKIREMNLKKYENIPAGTYSGGNKRKLSVAIAMIGNPAVILLDEPSTGMDPRARRFMWTIISKISKKNQIQNQNQIQDQNQNQDQIYYQNQNSNQNRYNHKNQSQICSNKKSSAVILTTHSMEEAEALSTKMVIMVEGQFKCLGSIQHINAKNKGNL